MPIDLFELATALGKIQQRLRLRRRTASEWTALNELLLNGEQGYETDTGKMKIGDGVTLWNDLDYWSVGGGGGGGGGGNLDLIFNAGGSLM